MSSNKVIFNTGITYIKSIFTALISLYATRIILKYLGSEDFGLFSVVGGVVGMLSFLNVAMSTSTQRFLSYNLGFENKVNRVRKIFANSVIIHFLLGIFIVIILELIGLYFIESKLKIDPTRLQEAKYIFHFVVVSTFITVISVPYEAVIISRENFLFLAKVGIFESILKLFVALSLMYLEGDLLLYFGFFTMLTAIIIRIIKRIYCRKMYKECIVNYIENYDFSEIKGLLSFATWNMFGALCGIAKSQGSAVLINMFYSTSVNAAYGVANQLNSQLMFFSETMLSSIRPQIMKSEGASDRARTIRLALIANKFAFYIFTFFAMPFFFAMPLILKLWLNEVPEYTIEFCRCLIVLTVVLQLSRGLMAAVQAIGKIKYYQIISGTIQILILPLGYLMLSKGYKPYYIVVLAICLEVLSTFFRVFYFNYLTGFSVKKYFLEVLLNPLSSLIPVVILLYLLQDFFLPNLIGLISLFTISSIIYVLLIYFIGLTVIDQKMLNEIIKKLKLKFKK